MPWDTRATGAQRCGSNDGALDVTYLGGLCSADCNGALQEELITGIDDPVTPAESTLDWNYTNGVWTTETYTTGYEAEYLSSIRQRVARGLNQLHEDTTVPAYDWGQYCSPDDVTGTRIEWDSVVVGGFSMGGSMAQYLGFTRTTAGVFSAEGLGDYCDVAWQQSPLAFVGHQNAGWITGSPATPDGDWRVAYHTGSGNLVTGLVPVDVNGWPTAWTPMGLLEVGESVDTTFDTWTGPGPWTWGQEVMSTSHATTNTNPHGAMGSDVEMMDTNGMAAVTPGADTEELLLFAPYLAAVCDL